MLSESLQASKLVKKLKKLNSLKNIPAPQPVILGCARLIAGHWLLAAVRAYCGLDLAGCLLPVEMLCWDQ